MREETRPRREALASATTPPGWVYTDADWYARERELVFFARWACVAREEQVGRAGQRPPGGPGRRVAPPDPGPRGRAARLLQRVPAPGDAARGRLGQGPPRHPLPLPRVGLRPRRHAPRHAQRASAEDFDHACYPLWSVAVDTSAGFVFVNLAADPLPLEAALADDPEQPLAFARFRTEDLRIGATIEYEVAANWKIVDRELQRVPALPHGASRAGFRGPGVRPGRHPRAGGLQRHGARPRSHRLLPSAAIPDSRSCPVWARRTAAPTTASPCSRRCSSTTCPTTRCPTSVLPLGPGRTRVVERLPLPPEDHRAARFRPGAGGRPVGHGEPPGLGALRARAARGRLARRLRAASTPARIGWSTSSPSATGSGWASLRGTPCAEA